MTRAWRRSIVPMLVASVAACASRAPVAAPGVPRYPAFQLPDVPATLPVSAAVRERHLRSWSRLQGGDVRGATRDFSDIVRVQPTFYPAETGLGYAHLADGRFADATTRFASAVRQDNRYVPAWVGLVDARLGTGDEPGAIQALERLLVLDPKRDAARTRLDVLRLRQLQASVDAGRRARADGRLEDARAALDRALALAGEDGVLLRELAVTEAALGSLDAALAHARRAAAILPDDAEAHASLGAIHDRRGEWRESAASYERAAALDSAYRDRAEAARAKRDAAAVPDDARALSGAASVTRGQLAALIGTRFEAALRAAPKRGVTVATDIRSHPAFGWIVLVTQAGIMDVSANHTFQPAAAARRDQLAAVVSRLLPAVAGHRSQEVARWRSARPAFADLAPANANYQAAAIAVSSGAMRLRPGDRFAPAGAATGADILAAITRLEALARR